MSAGIIERSMRDLENIQTVSQNSETCSDNIENDSTHWEYGPINSESSLKYKCNKINFEMPPPKRIMSLKEVNIRVNKKEI